MLLFNLSSATLSIFFISFQCITCCYSTLPDYQALLRLLISIHHMLLFNRIFALVKVAIMYFNTSYVIIQQRKIILKGVKNKFQYIPCCYSTNSLPDHVNVFLYISIHPMLLFNDLGYPNDHSGSPISIHPMLLFNAMGIFKESAAVCYFNTSHVIIQL